MIETRKLRVFLSYAREDQSVVRELYQRLLAEGWIEPWLDEEILLGGQNWAEVIEKNIENSDAFIIFLSNQSINKKGFVQREMRYAYATSLEQPENVIFLIPIRLDDCIPPRSLKDLHYIDFFGKNKDKTYSRLIQALERRKNQILEFEAIQKEEDQTYLAEQQRKRETQKANREKRRKEREEKAEQERIEKERLEKIQLEEKNRLEDEKKRLELEKEEFVNKYNEEKKRQERERQERIKEEETIRKEKEELKRRERALIKEKENEEKARKEAESKLQNEIKKQEDLEKRRAYEYLIRTILVNSLFVGVIALFVFAFLPVRYVNNLFIHLLTSLIIGGIVCYRLLKKLPILEIETKRTVLICASGGLTASLPLIISGVGLISPYYSYMGWMILITGVLGSGGFSYFLLKNDRVNKFESRANEIRQKILPLLRKFFDKLMLLVTLFIVSYAFSFLSLLLFFEYLHGFSTEVTELLKSYRTEMALLNGGFLSITFLLFGIFLSVKRKTILIDLDGQGCSWLFLILLAKIAFIMLGFSNKLEISDYYWLGIIFNPLYLNFFAFEFFDGIILIVVFVIQLIPLFILDLINLNIFNLIVFEFEKKDKTQDATSIEVNNN